MSLWRGFGAKSACRHALGLKKKCQEGGENCGVLAQNLQVKTQGRH